MARENEAGCVLHGIGQVLCGSSYGLLKEMVMVRCAGVLTMLALLSGCYSPPGADLLEELILAFPENPFETVVLSGPSDLYGESDGQVIRKDLWRPDEVAAGLTGTRSALPADCCMSMIMRGEYVVGDLTIHPLDPVCLRLGTDASGNQMVKVFVKDSHGQEHEIPTISTGTTTVTGSTPIFRWVTRDLLELQLICDGMTATVQLRRAQ